MVGDAEHAAQGNMDCGYGYGHSQCSSTVSAEGKPLVMGDVAGLYYACSPRLRCAARPVRLPDDTRYHVVG